MWFNIVKLDLSQVSTQIQGDTEGKNINIEADEKCKKKLINFQNRIMQMAETSKRATTHEKVFADKLDQISTLPETIACMFVEKINEFFNSITSFSYPVEKPIDIVGNLKNGKYDIIYFSSRSNIVMVLALKIESAEYFTRLILPKKDALLMMAAKKHWEES